MFQVTLFVEVPDGVEPPEQWNWNNLINHEGTTDENHTPVIFQSAHHCAVGNA